jgi:hypothetical protein
MYTIVHLNPIQFQEKATSRPCNVLQTYAKLYFQTSVLLAKVKIGAKVREGRKGEKRGIKRNL